MIIPVRIFKELAQYATSDTRSESFVADAADLVITNIYNLTFHERDISDVRTESGHRFYSVIHGGMHVSRTAIWLECFAQIYKHLGEEISPEDLKILQVVALMHDSGRDGDDGVDYWDKDSTVNCYRFLKYTLGFSDEAASRFASCIVNKDSTAEKTLTYVETAEGEGKFIATPVPYKPLIFRLMQVADCFDILRARLVFEVRYLDIWPVLKVDREMRDLLIAMINKARHVISTQGDQFGAINYKIKAKFHTNSAGCYRAIQAAIHEHCLFDTLLREGVPAALTYQNHYQETLPPALNTRNLLAHSVRNILCRSQMAGIPLLHLAQELSEPDHGPMMLSASFMAGAPYAAISLVFKRACADYPDGISEADCPVVSSADAGSGHVERDGFLVRRETVKSQSKKTKFQKCFEEAIDELEEGRVDPKMVSYGFNWSEVVIEEARLAQLLGVAYAKDSGYSYGLPEVLLKFSAILTHQLLERKTKKSLYFYEHCSEGRTLKFDEDGSEVNLYITGFILLDLHCQSNRRNFLREPVRVMRSLFKQRTHRDGEAVYESVIDELLTPSQLAVFNSYVVSKALHVAEELIEQMGCIEGFFKLVLSGQLVRLVEMTYLDCYVKLEASLMLALTDLAGQFEAQEELPSSVIDIWYEWSAKRTTKDLSRFGGDLANIESPYRGFITKIICYILRDAASSLRTESPHQLDHLVFAPIYESASRMPFVYYKEIFEVAQHAMQIIHERNSIVLPSAGAGQSTAESAVFRDSYCEVSGSESGFGVYA